MNPRRADSPSGYESRPLDPLETDLDDCTRQNCQTNHPVVDHVPMQLYPVTDKEELRERKRRPRAPVTLPSVFAQPDMAVSDTRAISTAEEAAEMLLSIHHSPRDEVPQHKDSGVGFPPEGMDFGGISSTSSRIHENHGNVQNTNRSFVAPWKAQATGTARYGPHDARIGINEVREQRNNARHLQEDHRDDTVSPEPETSTQSSLSRPPLLPAASDGFVPINRPSRMATRSAPAKKAQAPTSPVGPVRSTGRNKGKARRISPYPAPTAAKSSRRRNDAPSRESAKGGAPIGTIVDFESLPVDGKTVLQAPDGTKAWFLPCCTEPRCRTRTPLRKMVSHYFGRNKTQSDKMHGYNMNICRQHYQRKRYHFEKKDRYHVVQRHFVRLGLMNRHAAYPEQNWAIRPSKGLRDALDLYNRWKLGENVKVEYEPETEDDVIPSDAEEYEADVPSGNLSEEFDGLDPDKEICNKQRPPVKLPRKPLPGFAVIGGLKIRILNFVKDHIMDFVDEDKTDYKVHDCLHYLQVMFDGCESGQAINHGMPHMEFLPEEDGPSTHVAKYFNSEIARKAATKT